MDRTFYAGGALGALDTLLEEYFERDIESGILTEEEAVWMIASLFFNDTHYTQIGGLTPAGVFASMRPSQDRDRSRRFC